MKIKVITTLFFLTFSQVFYSQYINTGASMDNYYTRPMVEEGKRNIILQNRCGNRATLMFFNDSTEVQFVYKPNAYRRKDYRARNYSNRDNYTELFDRFTFPQLKESFVEDWGYDPFITRLKTRTPWDAKNEITIINIADENVFAIAARSPLMLVIKPKHGFIVRDGLLTESFTDRGEEIVSFIRFNGMEENRFRLTTSGEYVLQIFENEVILVGGEENLYQVNRVVEKLGDMKLAELAERNEHALAPAMDKGLITFKNPGFQRVVDLNHRIVYSGMDEGGACFGALNRIYYLIWVRDGSMTSSMMARAGNPELIKIWTEFLLNNPSVITREDGTKVKEFLQIVGSRWTKSEDDGVYYAALSLFTYYQTTGQTDLLMGDEFPLLLEVIDNFLDKTWNPEMGMIVSDTRGETPLKSNPYFGYDVVNGNFERNDHHLTEGGKNISASASLYNMVNTWNLLNMSRIMLHQRPELDEGRSARYKTIAAKIQETIRSKYKSPEGYLYSEYLRYDDGSDHWQPFAKGADYWEYTWAVSMGPFYPALDLQLKSARMIPDTWPKIRTYGYCPWNTLSRMLYEYGMTSDEYEKMLTDEVKEAMMLTRKYPMPGALTEYNTAVESWRGLPFSAGSFFYSVSAQMMQSLPMGVAVRASNKADKLSHYQFRLSTFNMVADGSGDVVEKWSLNDHEIPYTLQVPESQMVFGKNRIAVKRTARHDGFRLYSSTARLQDYSVVGNTIAYHFYSTIPADLIFENMEKAELSIGNKNNDPVTFSTSSIEGTNKTLVKAASEGEFAVKVVLK